MTNQWTTDYFQVTYGICQRVIGHPFYRYRLQCQLSRDNYQLSIAAPFQVINQLYKYTINEPWQFSTFRGCFYRNLFWAISSGCDVMVKKLLVSKFLQNWRVNRRLYTLFSNYTVPIVTVASAPLFRTTLAHVAEIGAIRMHFMDLLEQVRKEPLSYSSYSPRILIPLVGWKLAHNVIYSILNKYLPSLEIGNYRSDIVTILNYFLRHLMISGIADFVTYPLETFLVRSCLQGIDLVINDVSKGTTIGLESFVSGSSNVFTSLVSKEGYLGLYKGVCCLVLEYTLLCGLTLLLIHLCSKYGTDNEG